ncbi:MAG: hypothetical protein HC824_15030 [Synechococcales cyanobacterium RM1_1_8]|nr:hypothetical protein [Synechococcales cyanobacterium RM1_1_8]
MASPGRRCATASDAAPGLHPTPDPRPAAPPLSLPRLLGNALFAGMEGGILGMALLSLLGTTLLGSGAWLVLFGAIVALQYFRILGGLDLPIILAATFVLVLWLLKLPLTQLLIVAAAGGLITLALALFFQVVYRLLRQFL